MPHFRSTVVESLTKPIATCIDYTQCALIESTQRKLYQTPHVYIHKNDLQVIVCRVVAILIPWELGQNISTSIPIYTQSQSIGSLDLRIFRMPTLSSLIAQDTVLMTTPGAISNNNIDIITTLAGHWKKCGILSCRYSRIISYVNA